MVKQITSLFTSLFTAKKLAPEAIEQAKPVNITAHSQPYVLQRRMKEEKLTHGETVTANLSPVRVENHSGKMTLYFCPMENIEVVETLIAGDGGSIPPEAIVENLTIPANLKPGLYNLKNVTLTSNGTMQVKATDKTIWEKTMPYYPREFVL